MSFLIFKNGGILIAQEGTNAAWKALYASLSKRKGKLSEQAVRDTVNYAITRGRELGVPFEFTRSVLSNAMQESGMIHNARRGSHYGLIQATWIPRNYNAKQQIDMIYDMAQNPAKYKDNRVLGYEANLLNKSYRNPSTRNFFNWTERADVRTWNAAPRNVYDSAFDSYYKSVYTNPEPVYTNSQPVVDYASQHTVEQPDALRVAKPVVAMPVYKKQEGGPIDKINQSIDDWEREHPIQATALLFVPVIGSAMDIRNAVNDPSASNIFQAALSVGGDVFPVAKVAKFLTKAGRTGSRALSTMEAARRASLAARGRRALNAKQATLAGKMSLTGADMIVNALANPIINPPHNTLPEVVITAPRKHKYYNGGELGKDNTLSEVEVVAKYPHEQRVIDTPTGIGGLLRFISFKKGGKLRKNDKGETVPEICPKCGGKIGVFLQGEPIFKCTKCGAYFGVVQFSKSK